MTIAEVRIRLILTVVLLLIALRWFVRFVMSAFRVIWSSIFSGVSSRAPKKRWVQPINSEHSSSTHSASTVEEDITMPEMDIEQPRDSWVIDSSVSEVAISEETTQEVLSSFSLDDTAAPWEAVSKTPSDKKLSVKEQKKFDELRIDAITCKERGKLDLYEKKLIEALAIDPDSLEITRMLGDYYFDTWKHIKALSLLKRVVNEDPSNHKAVWQIGQIYLYENQIETAKLLVEKAISLKDDNPKYYISLVEIDYQLWQTKDAIKSLEKVLKLRPKNIEYLVGIATLHEENSEPSKAAYYYSKIIELDPMHDIAKSKLRSLHP